MIINIKVFIRMYELIGGSRMFGYCRLIGAWVVLSCALLLSCKSVKTSTITNHSSTVRIKVSGFFIGDERFFQADRLMTFDKLKKFVEERVGGASRARDVRYINILKQGDLMKVYRINTRASLSEMTTWKFTLEDGDVISIPYD